MRGGLPDQHSQARLAVCRAVWAVTERHVHIRLRVEYKRSAGDDRATAAAHGIVDLQRAAVRCVVRRLIEDKRLYS